MVYNFLGIDEKTEKSTYIWSECPYSVFEHPYSVSKQKPREDPPWYTSIWWYLRELPVLYRPEMVDIGVNTIRKTMPYA